jgi:hypothetical protein
MFDKTTIVVILVAMVVCIHLNKRQAQRLEDHKRVLAYYSGAHTFSDQLLESLKESTVNDSAAPVAPAYYLVDLAEKSAKLEK